MINIRCSTLPSVSDCCRMAVANTQRDLIADVTPEITLNEKNTGIYSALGTAVHSGNEHTLREKIITGELPKISDSIEIALNEFKSELKESESVLYDDTTPNIPSAEHQIKLLTKMYHRDVAPKVKFPDGADPDNHLEVYLETHIDDFLISGHVDVISETSILDTKSGKQPRPYHSQMGGYANLLKSSRDFDPKYLIINYLPRVKTDKVYPGTVDKFYPVDFSKNEAWYLIQQLMRDINNFKSCGNPACFQANPNSALCNKKYCVAYNTGFCEYCKE